ncbi:hypothetical protein GS518_01475 [Leptospira interrogans]|uniref:Lipoprotein n=13 Tax=Leptospira interrogans TaxID=173 RepID=A0A0E2D1V7_LEPIR|nr:MULTISPECIES: hypothetical protein [Leptospira]APH40290.1 Uncharacterized protein A9P81_0332 [Leptospira interrogans serovar Copenhageni/Icterohaemorrhagiae]EMF72229.1 hypothetical protein LEP1GSC148_3344 [Leptospira interrogans serovar Canicola str. LT1962]EMG13084.1 hypothetical protein LEP1GSC151_4694 [Leptospira interrogans serovar Grippotyphosa str. LT2186]EMM93781.1 hypothetical protein LEP1GSC158_4270 [Leptospira interrogans serovar Zanoni str. LT2156]EMO06709.1 hypothetical protein 
MKQHSLKKLRRSIFVVLLTFFLAASDSYADESEKKTYSTKNIDVTVKDKDGYNHFLVFTKVMTPDKSYVAYNVEFWVNNYVYSEMDTFSQISFKAGKKSFNGNFYKSDVSSNALVLYFYMEESVIKGLLASSADRLSIFQKNKTVFEYTIATKDNFKKALKEITTVE